jgi:hypothetical protein
VVRRGVSGRTSPAAGPLRRRVLRGALPYVDASRAVSGLRGQLRMLAQGDGAVPNWATLRVAGPDQVVGRHGVVWYEWSAEVDACGPHSREE